MLHPLRATAKEKKKLAKSVLSVKRNPSGIEIVELLDDSDDTEDNKINDCENHKSAEQHQKKKAKREHGRGFLYV